jgi:HK97 family phage major capsid protein
MVEEIKSAFEGVKTEVNGAIETLKADNAVAVDGLKSELEELKSQVAVVKDAADKLEAKNNRKTMNENQVKGFNASLAEAIEKNADLIGKVAAGETKSTRFILDTKTVGNMTEAANLTGDIQRQYAPQVYALPSRKVHVRSLLPVGTISTGLFTFPQETGGEGNPAPQVQGASKAQVDFDITMADAPAQYIAGFTRISRQMLDDVPAMTSFLQARLLEKYLVAEDAQLLSGDGTAPNLKGILEVASSYAGSSTVNVAQLIESAAQIEAANYSANGILINPTDWATILLTQNTDSPYSLPGATVVSPDGSLSIAGIPVFKSTAIDAGTFLVGDWSMGAQIMQNQGIGVQFSEMDADNFTKNLITVRVEARIAFPIYYSGAFVTGTFGGAE